jgi:3-deoxy-D-manno-octulosonate 8-phosphate phosphatase (KDO 8-P phosphatase)
MSKDAMELARAVRLLICDVDGVLTDGRIIFDDNGVQSKSFDVRDGHGLKMLQREGVTVALITGRSSKVVEARARELGITEVFQGIKQKRPVFEELIARLGLKPREVAYVGDDVVDLPVMVLVGLSVAVADAHADVRAMADHVTERPGGRGAVREVCELILKAKGHWDEIIKAYCAT